MSENTPKFSVSPMDVVKKIKAGMKVPFSFPLKSSSKGNRIDVETAVEKYLGNHPGSSFDLCTDGGRWNAMFALANILKLEGYGKDEIVCYLDRHSCYETDSVRQFTRPKVLNQLDRIFMSQG
jgi:hypothetical protein